MYKITSRNFIKRKVDVDQQQKEDVLYMVYSRQIKKQAHHTI